MASVLKKGLTLAEVLLSLGLCVVVVLSAIALSISALRSNNKSSDSITAQSRAGQVLEEFVYALPPSNASFWSQSSFSSPYQQDATQIGDKTYNSQVFLTSLGSTSPGLFRCSVNTTWQGGQAGAAGQGKQVVEVARILYAQ